MALNIWLLIISAAVLILIFIIVLWKRPRLPLITLVMIIELIFYIYCTSTVNSCISPSGGMIQSASGEGLLLNIIIGRGERTAALYELAFNNLSVIVAILIAATIISIFIEVYLTIINPIRSSRQRRDTLPLQTDKTDQNSADN